MTQAAAQITAVMAGFIPAIHVLFSGSKQDVDARDEPGHDDVGTSVVPKVIGGLPTAHFAAVTTISTICGGSRSTPMQARIGGFFGSTHSSQARFISPFRFMSVM